jgi:5-methylthioribose kinase
MRHLGCLLMARIDGKSPVEYLTDEGVKQKVRDLARQILVERPRTVGEVF